MSDVLTIQDLQTAKKHDTFHSEVITGKAGGLSTGADIDYSTNAATEQVQKTLPAVIRDLSFQVQTWTATTGGILNDPSEVFLDDMLTSAGKSTYFAWTGAFPKTVAPGTDPALTPGFVRRYAPTAPTGGDGEQVFASVSDVRAATGLQVGKKIYLQGYYSDTPGVGGGALMVTDDTITADNGGTVFVTADGVRLKRERKLRLKASDFGARGDWNGTTGTDNKPFIEAMIAASNSSQPWEIDLNNVGVTWISIDQKSNWEGYISGSVFNMSSKPVAGATDEKATYGGVSPTFKITNCDKWKIKGGYVDNRYREAFYVEQCNKFVNECDVIGSGLNNNLRPNYYRFCGNFKLRNFRHERTSEKPATGYYSHCNNINLWDCANFKLLDFDVVGTGSNGVYVGSNCHDYVISGFNINNNAMSAIQLAWSSFGAFPYRGTISDGFTNGNRADGLDVNNTSSSAARIDLVVSGLQHTNNGYNDDGTVTVDGSGIGTFMNVTHFDIIACHSVDSARAGLFVVNCTDWTVSGGSISKQKTTNNDGEGVYIEAGVRFSISGIHVVTQSSQEALKLYGAMNTGKIGGTYTGIISLPAPDATTTYTDIRFVGASLYASNQIVTRFPIDSSKIYGSGDTLLAAHNISNTDVRSVNGTATTIGFDGVCVYGGTHRGGVNGIRSVGFNNVKIDSAKGVADTSGAGITIDGGSKITLLHTNSSSTSGTGNSMKITSTTTKVTMLGNSFGTGTVTVASGTYTLKDF